MKRWCGSRGRLAATLTVVVVGVLGGAAPALGATMVGKGSGRLGGTTNPLQTYAYIIPCSSPVGWSPSSRCAWRASTFASGSRA